MDFLASNERVEFSILVNSSCHRMHIKTAGRYTSKTIISPFLIVKYVRSDTCILLVKAGHSEYRYNNKDTSGVICKSIFQITSQISIYIQATYENTCPKLQYIFSL